MLELEIGAKREKSGNFRTDPDAEPDPRVQNPQKNVLYCHVKNVAIKDCEAVMVLALRNAVLFLQFRN